MDIFWDVILGPLVTLLRPKTILEVGSEQGLTTRLLLSFCRCYDAVLHAIDPSPLFDANGWVAENNGRFVFHKALSLEAMPKLGPFDLVLLDGDHNWYTVYNELKLIEKRCAEKSHPFPMVLFHDVGWPYGRRDLYYNPATIPPEFRQPYARKGMRPGTSELLEQGGFNTNLNNAIHEGGPRNGVLTAVEDFFKETSLPMELIAVPGFHGLGILCPKQLTAANAALGQFLKSLELPPIMQRYLGLLEGSRVVLFMRMLELQGALGYMESAQKEVAEMQKKLQSKEAEVAELHQVLTDIETVLTEIQSGAAAAAKTGSGEKK